MLAELVVAEVGLRFVQARLRGLEFAPEHQSGSVIIVEVKDRELLLVSPLPGVRGSVFVTSCF